MYMYDTLWFLLSLYVGILYNNFKIIYVNCSVFSRLEICQDLNKSVPSTNCLVAYCTVKHTYHTLFYVWLKTILRFAGLDVPRA